ncbi:hypothetical protein [Streptomyces sp. NPDC090135]|uniref:hypothetical protein n=1 Tax=Streptomyces sp. NPDC090135 TaxID=3365957 RepID=UPI00380728CC
MNTLRAYFENNPDLFAALVAALAIIGGLAGSVIGSKIQANGGRDQARAAREAAEIAAEAQRAATLWAVRQAQAVEFAKMANEFLRTVDVMFKREPEREFLDRAQSEFRAIFLKRVEIEITATGDVAEFAVKAETDLSDFMELARSRGPAVHAWGVLEGLTESEDQSIASRAAAARLMVRDWKYTHHTFENAFGVRLEGRLPGPIEPFGDLTEMHIQRIRFDAINPDIEWVRQDLEDRIEMNMHSLVNAIRGMLGSGAEMRP